MKTALVGIISLVLVSTLFEYPYMLLLLLLALSSLFLIYLKKRSYLYLFGITGVVGLLAEAFAIHFGAWAYAIPQVIEVPVWLPVLWGLAGVLIARVWNRVDREALR